MTPEQFCQRLPKAELHVHLEGCLDADLLFTIARRNDVPVPWATPNELRAAYHFTGLPSFLQLYFAGCRVLLHRRDFYDITRAYLEQAHAAGVVRAEMFLGPQTFVDQGVPIDDILGGVFEAIDEAGGSLGISAALLVSAHRHRTEQDAFALLDSVMPWADRIGGFGLGGAEAGNPPAKFTAYFRELRRLRFRTCVHAGEEGSAADVRAAHDTLQPDRIDHGIAAARDQRLLADLATAGTPLTVCPISNEKLAVVDELRHHPLPVLLDAGVRVSLHSDDPAYFDAGIGDVYARVMHELDFSPAVMIAMARNGLRDAFWTAGEAGPALQELNALDQQAGGSRP